tara:strand:+ start:203 stop:412 length:210 start_codon:yes stop_codon:yes gene_type:complete
MCIGNTTSPAASNNNYFGWRDDEWERPEVIDEGPEGSNRDKLKGDGSKRSGEKGGKGGKQSDKTTGGNY